VFTSERSRVGLVASLTIAFIRDQPSATRGREHGSRHNGTDDLRHDVGQDLIGGEPATGSETNGDGRIQVASGTVTDGIGHRQNRKAKGQCNTKQADTDSGKARRNDSAAAASKRQPKVPIASHAYLRVFMWSSLISA